MAKKQKLSEFVEVEATVVIPPLGMYKGQKSGMKRSRYEQYKHELKLIGNYGQRGSDTVTPTEQADDNGDSGSADLQEPGASN